MSQLVFNLPWIVIWLVALAVQGRFLRNKNLFGALIVLWVTLIVGVFWNKAIGALVPGISGMWLFGTKIWVLFLILGVRHYLSLRKERRLQAAKLEEEGSAETQETKEE